MSRITTTCRRATKRRRPRTRARRQRARADDWVRIFVEVFVDALFGPPLLTHYNGFPASESEPQPATFRVLEPKALPAPKETS